MKWINALFMTQPGVEYLQNISFLNRNRRDVEKFISL